MRKLALLTALLTLGSIARAGAPEEPAFRFRHIGTCDDARPDLLASDRIVAKRKGANVIVRGSVVLNCATAPVDPKVEYRDRWVSLFFDTKSPSGAYAACVCAAQFEFELLERVAPGTAIYLIQRNAVSARTVAP